MSTRQARASVEVASRVAEINGQRRREMYLNAFGRRGIGGAHASPPATGDFRWPRSATL